MSLPRSTDLTCLRLPYDCIVSKPDPAVEYYEAYKNIGRKYTSLKRSDLASTVLQTAIDLLTSGGKIWIKDMLTTTSKVIVKDGIELASFGRYNQNSEDKWGGGLDGAFDDWIIEMQGEYSQLSGLLVRNTVAGGVYVDDHHTRFSDVNISAKTDGINFTANGRGVRLFHCVLSGVGYAGSRGIYNAGLDQKIQESIIRGFETGIYNEGDGVFIGSLVHIFKSPASSINYCIYNTANYLQVFDCYLEGVPLIAGIMDTVGGQNRYFRNHIWVAEDADGIKFGDAVTSLSYASIKQNFIRGASATEFGNIAIRGDNVNGVVLSEIKGNTVMWMDSVGLKTENGGNAVFSGDGSTTVFNIPHELIVAPKFVSVEPITDDARGARLVTKDATNIVVTFDTAPPSGTDNVKFSWKAELLK